jgi:hypothetical protein
MNHILHLEVEITIRNYNSDITMLFFHDLSLLFCNDLMELLSLMAHNLQLLLKFRNLILQENIKEQEY